MASEYTTGSDFIIRRCRGETLRVEAWTDHCIRVRATLESNFGPHDWSIEPKKSATRARVVQDSTGYMLECGMMSVRIPREEVQGPNTLEAPLSFIDTRSGAVLLREKQSRIVYPDPGHTIKAVEPGSYRVEARFEADPEERFYGLGHNQNGYLNQKGCVLELRQMNTHTVVPVLYSSKGYGFFWNNPAYGRVELARNGTYWLAESTDQLDYFVYTGSGPAGVAHTYATLTGFPGMMPDWAMGFWQCKLRYRTQEELLTVAHEFRQRGLPLSVLVIDFFHWTRMGEWDFDPQNWPEPEAMIKELKELGIETMVSIWPTVNSGSSHFREMMDRGYLVRAENGLPCSRNLPIRTRMSRTFISSISWMPKPAGTSGTS